MNISLGDNFFLGPFDIASCRARLVASGLPLTLDLADCERYCGKGYGSYNIYDALDAITTWLIPLLALSANMVFADSSLLPVPYGGRIFVIVRQYADPIGTIIALSSKLTLGSSLCEMVRRLDLTALELLPDKKATSIRDISNILYCMDDFGSDELERRVEGVLQLITNHGNALYPDIRAASRELSLARVRNNLSIAMSIVVYVGAAFSALLKSDNGSQLDYAQPHTIALRELCYFLLLQIILSAAGEGWSQQWTPQFIMARLGQRFHEYEPSFGWLELGRKQIEPWDGGISSFRPHDGLFRRGRSICAPSRILVAERRGKHAFTAALAILSIWVSFVISFTMSWFTPTRGLGGRGVAEMTYLAVWTINFLINEWMCVCIKDRKRLFNLIWAKDSVISVLLVLFFLLPFIGWYNSCRSWSAYFSKGAAASINLNLGQVEAHQTWSLYFTGIAAGAAVQGILAVVIIGFNFDACKLSYRDEKENLEAVLQDEEGPQEKGTSDGASTSVIGDSGVTHVPMIRHEDPKSTSIMTREIPRDDSKDERNARHDLM